MNVELNHPDGKIGLNPSLLKTLRKKHGYSQESLAQLCLSKRLCVSVASIKRAEAGKSVLYRTARHLAEIYRVELTTLITPSTIIAAESSQTPIISNKTLHLLISQPYNQHDLFEVLRYEINKWGGTVELLDETVAEPEMIPY